MLRVLGAACALIGALALPFSAAAQPAPPPLPPTAHVVVSGLINPRGFTWSADGALYIAEAGSPPAGYMPPQGPPQPGAPPAINTNSRISRAVPGGTRTTVVDRLPVSVGPIGD